MQDNNTLARPALELGMQELEAMEAPGFWDTVGGIFTGVSVASAASYVSYAVSVATVAT
ncbi:hypothetical protein OG943_09100 [Amycolatopsis sp. NBC_00345]|uniref:daptide-type RiPP n=1 Tax=Amycolatopsis sp. NBC_00345 TaxID=2975955 RepID=UPI002E262E59